MKIIIESTDTVIDIGGGMKARLWEGHTDSGIPVHAFIPGVAVNSAHDQTQFEREMIEVKPASVRFPAIAIDLRHVI